FTSRPNPNQEIAANDQNSWAPLKPGQLQVYTDGNFAVYRTTFQPYEKHQKEGAKIILKDITGKAEVWIDKKQVAVKSTPEKGDMTVTIPPAEGDRELNVLIETQQGQKAGLGGVVNVIDL
ncbi:MAG: hypothetical protein Q8862_12190, partial [Bacteroidota bacterium]|nr:hypothetical protein [Bacteroidota bacterium]